MFKTLFLILLALPACAQEITHVVWAPGMPPVADATAIRVPRVRTTYDDATAHAEQTANGLVTVKSVARRDTVGYDTRYRLRLHLQPGEAIYGLGSHMEDYMDLSDKTLYLVQHNLKAVVPMLLSTEGYGILFNCGCAMKWDKGTMELDAADTLDYYIIRGKDFDQIVAGYRKLTGQVPLMPRYLFGYTQSKERYTSSADIIATLAEYRRRHVPIDMIVQDWNYWPQGWGYMKMDPKHYPDPKGLADSVHAMNARLMVSIWPNPQYCPEADDMKERGFMLEGSVYDAFNPAARDRYWDYANSEFFAKGFDAWWCDSSEPVDGDWNKLPEPEDGQPYTWDCHERRYRLNKEALASILGPERTNIYSLYHAQGIWEHQRAATDQKRVVNLTRSSWAGQQKYGTIVWNGDTHASWQSFRQQIPAGLNYMATGCPYWTVDIGGFFTHTDQRWFCRGEFPDGAKDPRYHEYYTRMLQWAAFLPVMRSHGTDTPREIWRFGEPGTKYYDAILKAIRLRYSLIPYIYSMAAAQTFHGYTMARMLAFDFPADTVARQLKDEYMFGAFLVCPVVEEGAATRRVWLPKAGDDEPDWTDYHTGKRHKAGQWIETPTTIDRIPLFVRGGSIITTTEPQEYADAQTGKEITATVFPGRDAQFIFYEDAGDGYAYERGEYTTINMKWNDKRQKLSIGKAKGRKVNVRVCAPGIPPRD